VQGSRKDARGRAPATLPDYLADGLEIVSVGLNPSPRSVAAGFYFAHPRNRFWAALEGSGLAPSVGPPGREALERLLRHHRIGFTDVVKRPSPGSGALRAADFRRWAPVLAGKLARHRPGIVWFHGAVAYRGFLKHGIGRTCGAIAWGEQAERIGSSRVFVTPNPSPANAAYRLDDLIRWYRLLGELRARLRPDGG